MSDRQLDEYFRARRFDTENMSQRGAPIGPSPIEKGERYLISEMACKSLEAENFAESELAKSLVELYRSYTRGEVTVEQILEGYDALDDLVVDRADLLRKLELLTKSAVELFDHRMQGQIRTADLLEGAKRRGEFKDIQLRLSLTADEFLDAPIADESDLLSKIESVHRAYEHARSIALKNTESYLSMVGDLDVYVATSMRDRDDFRRMADFCENVFHAEILSSLHLRYFDPTLSAAKHHEDKGLIECLMVRRAKALVLYAGSRDSYGKDAEAAMALSLGKPVIIHADEEYRRQFFRDVHPLSRLIDFETGVATGAMIATSEAQVADLLNSIFTNDLEFELEQAHENYLALREKMTKSVVRLQTSDELIRETFWNHYHSDLR